MSNERSVKEPRSLDLLLFILVAWSYNLYINCVL